ncbi:MAG: hypothetical protein M1825_003582 [Sarcosagium campestre]|nr:MAG: hypothetical protein M1825_003582 [Sarcosagium campestre]
MYPTPKITEKLELPSISQVHTRGPADVPWYNSHYAQRPSIASERLPSLSLSQPSTQTGPSSGTSSPRVNSLASSSGTTLSSQTSVSSNGSVSLSVKNSPPRDINVGYGVPGQSLSSQSPNHSPFATPTQSVHGFAFASESDVDGSMNQTQPYMDVHQSHLSGGPQHAPSTVTAGGMSQYPHYGQPPLLQPGPGSYPPPQASYGPYGYPNRVASPQSAGHPSTGAMVSSQVPAQLLPLPTMAAGGPTPPGPNGLSGQGYQQQFDTTGQMAPGGMKPRVTATLWEDEGSLCFQVEAKGVCVARREDNHMINGTKLLNVAGMTRGRRDGILKSEKMRHVVKIGPMHLKGVWIPFERALDFANKEKITEMLYPLFVYNIGALLYHPTNQTRTATVMAAAERRRQDQQVQQPRNPQSSQPPSLHHHHSMHNPMGSHLPGPPHQGQGRPGLDRAHTFPTPPTSAGILGMGGPENAFQWSGQPMGNQGSQPLSIDTGLSNARSMPTTPATTPPGASLQNMQQYPSGPGYDNARPVYSGPPAAQNQYGSSQNVAQQNMARFGQPMQPSQYIKNEMGPPSTRAPGTGSDGEHQSDSKGPDGMINHGQGNEQGAHGPDEDGGEHEHDADYAHDAAYNGNRGPYNYNPGPPVGALTNEHPHLSPELTGSPGAQAASDRVTPRGGPAAQPQWAQGYNTPPRAQPPSSNLYSVMSTDPRATTNGAGAGDAYASQPVLGGPIQGSYPSQPHPVLNGNSSNKRVREIDDDGSRGSRPSSRGADGEVEGLKRRKTIRGDESLPGVTNGVGANGFDRDPNRPINRARAPIVQRRR